MLTKSRLLLSMVVLIVLTNVFVGTRPAHAADNLWSVVSAIKDPVCFVDEQGQARLQWTEVKDVSLVPGMTDVVKDTMNGQATFQGTILLDTNESTVTTTGPVWLTAPKFPLVYIARSKAYTPDHILTSTSVYILACNRPGKARSAVWFDKNTN